MKNLIKTAAVMGFAAVMLSAQNLPPAGGAPAPAGTPAAAPGGPSKEETEALQKIQQTQQANDADGLMKAVDDFTIKFPTSTFRGPVLTMAGDAARTKNNGAKARFYYENAVKADPESDYAMIMLATIIAQGTGENDLDKKQKLDQAQSYVDKGMDLVNKRTKRPGESDQQFTELKKDDLAMAHTAEAFIKMANSQNGEAGKEFLTAVDTAAHGDASNLIRAGMAFNNAKQFDEANKALDRFLALPGIPDQYKKIAEDEKKRGQQLKNQK
jgi:tetratricopeptide (TPR) repeat protein